jgi:hypothetical protein
MEPRSTAAQEYVLVDLPPSPHASFRSVESDDPPFHALRLHLERATGQELGFPDVAISLHDFAQLRHETRRWVETRQRLGLDVEADPATVVDMLCVEGLTAPVISRKLKPGHALVAHRIPEEVA